MKIHNILYNNLSKYSVEKSKKKKNSFKTYVIYGRQDWNCVDRMHDLLESSCFHCRDPECHHDEKRTKRFTDSTHVLIPLRSNFIFKPCFDPLPQRTLLSEWFCCAPISWSLHINTLLAPSTLVSSLFVFIYIHEWKWKNRLIFKK